MCVDSKTFIFHDVLLFLLHSADMTLVILDKGAKAKLLIDVAYRMPLLKWLIVIDGSSLTDDIREAAQKAGIKIDDFESVQVRRCSVHAFEI